MALTLSSRAVPILRPLGTVRVLFQLLRGLSALALVRVGHATLGRRPAGLAVLGRFGGRLVELAGPAAAVRTAAHARRAVPAYRSATRAANPWHAAFQTGRLTGYLEALPVLDKAGYIDHYPLAQRCRGGRLPAGGVELDESSGSSGRPYQWLRSRAELDQIEQGLAVQARLMLRSRGHERVVVLNCFSMGAWATGSSVTAALRGLGMIKSCGPDADKALAAIELIGPDACYVICGYPPFLATLLDAAASRGIDLTGYELWGFVGGEGMTEVLRGRLQQRAFRQVRSAYGASDLDIGVAGETDAAVALRQAAAADPDLAQALFGHTGRLPMVFQYDPSTYHVETVGGELVVTVTRQLLSPRVRYAVHDAGGSLSYRAALRIAAAHGVRLPTGGPRLPFLFVAGRADSTVSYLGANLYPEDVDAALGLLADQHPDLKLGAFCLELVDTADGTSTPRIHVEAQGAALADPGVVAEQLRAGIAGWLIAHNRDWAAAATENPRALAFDVRLAAPGSGPFQANAHRIKRRYVLR